MGHVPTAMLPPAFHSGEDKGQGRRAHVECSSSSPFKKAKNGHFMFEEEFGHIQSKSPDKYILAKRHL